MNLTPLIVTANLATPYSAADPWSPSIDGLLAYWVLREQLGEEEFALGMTGHREQVVPELPLGKEKHDGLWWWQCSSPFTNVVQRQIRHFHKRFDDHYAAKYAPAKQRGVLVAGGPFKNYRNPRVMHVTPWVQWHVIGDGDEIRRLLRRCVNIGFGHTKGYGQVSHWDVQADSRSDLARYCRPVPVAFAEEHELDGVEMTWGILPPGRDPDHQHRCILPRQEILDGSTGTTAPEPDSGQER